MAFERVVECLFAPIGFGHRFETAMTRLIIEGLCLEKVDKCPYAWTDDFFCLFVVFRGDFPQLGGISESLESQWDPRGENESETTLFAMDYRSPEGEFRPLYWQ